jgi:hypothetical protein
VTNQRRKWRHTPWGEDSYADATDLRISCRSVARAVAESG